LALVLLMQNNRFATFFFFRMQEYCRARRHLLGEALPSL